MAKGYSLPYTNDVNVSSNEILNRHTINRNFEKLLENDLTLSELYYKTVDITKNINPYIKGIAYNKGSLIWFSDISTNSVYLLESMIDNNTKFPVSKLVNNRISFEDSAWKDKNQLTTIIKNTFKAYILENISKKFSLLHENNADFHKFKDLTSDIKYNDTKLLLNNLNNIESNRKKNFYPYETIQLTSDNVIVKGYYRKWENGLLEYDIVYKLGYVGTKVEDYITYNVYKSNDVVVDYNTNSDYFKTEKDSTIFSQTNPKENDSVINNNIQTNRGNFVNSYSSKLIFPAVFMDTNYMIFSSDITIQTLDKTKPTIDSGSNTITYINKTKKSIDPLYITFIDNKKLNPSESGIITNTFHCQIVGRWK